MLHRASPDEAVSARVRIVIRYRSPLLVFLKSMISTEQKSPQIFRYATRVYSGINNLNPVVRKFSSQKNRAFWSHRFLVRITDSKPITERAAATDIGESGDLVVGGGRGVRAALITTFCPALIDPESV